jgi:hypothetical protein
MSSPFLENYQSFLVTLCSIARTVLTCYFISKCIIQYVCSITSQQYCTVVFCLLPLLFIEYLWASIFSFTKGPASNTFSDLLLYCDFPSVFSTVQKYTAAVINPEFFSSYFSMTQQRWKTSDFIEAKTNLHRYISRIILFIKIAVSINDSLDPGPQALAGLRHGVPVEGPHHLLDLLDKILGCVARLCYDLSIRPTQNREKISIRRAGRTDLLLLHLQNSAFNGVSKRF